MFRRSVVLMDRLAPDQGAFPHALDLAHRLRLPVHGVSFPAWGDPGPEKGRAGGPAGPLAPAEGGEGRENSACALACARASVRWEWSRLDGHPLTALRQAVAPDDLLVFDQALPAAEKEPLVRQALRDQSPAILVCPAAWRPLSRALLVDQGHEPDLRFLLRAAELCRRLEVEAVVLTVARSERAAKGRQEAARAALAEHGLGACFDSLVGAEVRAAVGCVARWRHCQLVVVPREEGRICWRWLRSPNTDWMMRASEFASLLSLPTVGPPGLGAEPPARAEP